jgi:hypothetical protein
MQYWATFLTPTITSLGDAAGADRKYDGAASSAATAEAAMRVFNMVRLRAADHGPR